MFPVNIGKDKIIFDSEDYFNLIMDLSSMKSKKRSIWVDHSRSKPYAMMSFNSKNLKLHHIITGQPIQGYMIDHLNGNSLDNRSSNLKVVPRGHNSLNRPSRGKYKRWVVPQTNGKFQAQIRISLGTFDTQEEAHAVALNYIMNNNKDLYIHEGYL